MLLCFPFGNTVAMNELKVNRQHSILSLFEQGWSKRRIARELGVDRATIRKYLADGTSKSPTPQTGSPAHVESNHPPTRKPALRLNPALPVCVIL